MPDISEEDEIQRAIALSLEGGQGALGAGFAGGSAGGAAETGWGERLARQEREEEQKYKEEAERAVREEVANHTDSSSYEVHSFVRRSSCDKPWP